MPVPCLCRREGRDRNVGRIWIWIWIWIKQHKTCLVLLLVCCVVSVGYQPDALP